VPGLVVGVGLGVGLPTPASVQPEGLEEASAGLVPEFCSMEFLHPSLSESQLAMARRAAVAASRLVPLLAPLKSTP